MSQPSQSFDQKPQKIVGIYLTELGFVMAKIKMSNSSHMNVKIAEINDLLSPELSNLPIDLNDWRFVPCCE
jgi:hypothetical protein